MCPKPIPQDEAQSEVNSALLTPEHLCKILPGMTTTKLAQLRFTGSGPRYYKPTGRTIIYSMADVMAWLESTARTATYDEDVA
jgi:hypothetical protein